MKHCAHMRTSLVPRPFEEGKEKGPGTYGQRMHQYLPESIRIPCRGTHKPRGARVNTNTITQIPGD